MRRKPDVNTSETKVAIAALLNQNKSPPSHSFSIKTPLANLSKKQNAAKTTKNTSRPQSPIKVRPMSPEKYNTQQSRAAQYSGLGMASFKSNNSHFGGDEYRSQRKVDNMSPVDQPQVVVPQPGRRVFLKAPIKETATISTNS